MKDTARKLGFQSEKEYHAWLKTATSLGYDDNITQEQAETGFLLGILIILFSWIFIILMIVTGAFP